MSETEADEFLQANSRTFLLGTRPDGSPTGWPMVGLYCGRSLEFSTYRRSQKVVDFTRDPRACCVVAPVDGDRALVLRGRCELVAGQTAPATGDRAVPTGIEVADGIIEGAHARMQSGKRVVLRFTAASSEFVPGWGAAGS